MTQIDPIKRAALAIRGRFGADVWQAWSNKGMHDQQDWIAAQVPQRCPVEMRRALVAILHGEGIRRTEAADCCTSCALPIRHEV